MRRCSGGEICLKEENLDSGGDACSHDEVYRSVLHPLKLQRVLITGSTVGQADPGNSATHAKPGDGDSSVINLKN